MFERRLTFPTNTIGTLGLGRQPHTAASDSCLQPPARPLEGARGGRADTGVSLEYADPIDDEPPAGERLASPLLVAAANLALDAAAVEVSEALRAVGERSILLRGPSIVEWLYRDEPRPYSDIDFLVDASRVAEAERVLERLGFRRSAAEIAFANDSPAHAATWVRSTTCVDLHRTLVGARCTPADAWTALSEQTEWLAIGGGTVEALRPAARAVVVALHAAHQGDEFPHTREDLARAISVATRDDWREAAALATELDASGAMAVGLMRLPEGVQLAAELGLEPDNGRRREGSSAFHVAQAVRWFWLTPGLRHKSRYALEKLFLRPDELRRRSRLARRGRVGLGLGYVVRLGSVIWHGPAAVRGLLRMRRARARRDRGGRGV